MTDRQPVGATNRSDLFGNGGSSGRDKAALSGGRVSGRSNNGGNITPHQGQMPFQKDDHGFVEEKLPEPRTDDPLQLEHIVGYSGNFRKTILNLPHDPDRFVRSMGSLIAVENLYDAHDQRLLRGHDMQVSAMAVSSTGKFVASGQIGTKNYRGDNAPVLVWDMKSFTKELVLRGLTQKVNILDFSGDEKLLCGTGEDSVFYIWDTSTGEVLYGQRTAQPISVMKWVDYTENRHYTTYELVMGIGNVLNKAVFSFDPSCVQWKLKMQPFLLPPGGSLVRWFTTIELSHDKRYVFCGTTGGEMMVFSREAGIFRALIPVCSNAIGGILTLPSGEVVVGGGNGWMHKLAGNDISWRDLLQVNLDSAICSISLAPSQTEVIVGCESGSIYRAMVGDFTKIMIGISHTSAITAIAIPYSSSSAISGSGSSTLYVTGSASGILRTWDSVDYACQAINKVQKAGGVNALFIVDNMGGGGGLCVISGWEDGFVRCHDVDTLGRQLWYIPNAHRGGVTSICAYVGDGKTSSAGSAGMGGMRYFVTGGRDGTVRIWRLDSREMVTQYAEHPRGVVSVLVDLKSPNVLHSLGGDCSVLSWDIKANRRIISHISNTSLNTGGVRGGAGMHSHTHTLCLTQRRDSELELVSSDAYGKLQFWDIDYRDPVASLQDPSGLAIRVCTVSPSGSFLAFAGDDHYVKVLEMSSGSIISLGQAHSNTVLSLAWTADERQVVSGGEDCCLCVWNFFLGGGPPP